MRRKLLLLTLALSLWCFQMDRQQTIIEGLRGQLKWQKIMAQIERSETWQAAMDWCREAS